MIYTPIHIDIRAWQLRAGSIRRTASGSVRFAWDANVCAFAETTDAALEKDSAGPHKLDIPLVVMADVVEKALLAGENDGDPVFSFSAPNVHHMSAQEVAANCPSRADVALRWREGQNGALFSIYPLDVAVIAPTYMRAALHMALRNLSARLQVSVCFA